MIGNWIIVIIGLVFCFFSVKIRKICLAISGAGVGLLLGYIILLEKGEASDADALIVIGCSILCGVLFVALEKFFVLLSTFSVAGLLTYLLLYATNDSLQQEQMASIAMLVGLILGIIAVVLYDIFYIIMTCFPAAYAVSVSGYGIMHDWPVSAVKLRVLMNAEDSGLIVIATLVLGIVGFIYQWDRLHKSKEKRLQGPNESE